MLSFENIAYFDLILHLTGGIVAVFLYAGLGRIFWIPMAIDLVYWHAVGLIVDNLVYSFYYTLFMSIFRSLIFVWIVYLTGIFRSRWFTLLVFFIMMFASFINLFSIAAYESLGEKVYCELLGVPDYVGEGNKWQVISFPLEYIWGFLSFVIISGVLFSETILRWIRGQTSTFITNPRKRVLIPLLLYSGMLGFSHLFYGFIDDKLLYAYYLRNQLAGALLGWGWVAMELPFYIMYRRMLKRYPEMVRRDQVDSYWKK